MRINRYFWFYLDSSMSSAKVTNNNRNVKNPSSNLYSSSIRWESIAIFDFNSIPPCLQQRLPIKTETSKFQCRMVSPQVIEENQSIFFILTRFLHVFREGKGKENNAVAMVTYKISSQIFSISQRETYPFLLKLG